MLVNLIHSNFMKNTKIPKEKMKLTITSEK